MMTNEKRQEFAERLYKFYIEKISPLRKTKAKAIKNILKHSKKYSFKDMGKAVVNYKSEALERDREFRKNPCNFFNVTGELYFKNYLPETFNPEKLVKNEYCSAPPTLTAERLAYLNS